MFKKFIYAAVLLFSVLIFSMGFNAVDSNNKEAEGFIVNKVLAAETEERDIQWFRDQLGISEQYIEEPDGIWGMSWAHFLTMLILVLFALGALVLFVMQQKRTREIMESIRKEMEHGDGNTG